MKQSPQQSRFRVVLNTIVSSRHFLWFHDGLKARFQRKANKSKPSLGWLCQHSEQNQINHSRDGLQFRNEVFVIFVIISAKSGRSGTISQKINLIKIHLQHQIRISMEADSEGWMNAMWSGVPLRLPTPALHKPQPFCFIKRPFVLALWAGSVVRTDPLP